jgi:hypothetical protein
MATKKTEAVITTNRKARCVECGYTAARGSCDCGMLRLVIKVAK